MPSIPQSLLWISLVVLWLFVLVPMLISKRDAVRRTSDVALATRVLNSGAAARLIKRGGPAAGHRSDPDWQPEEDEYDDDVDDLDYGRRSRNAPPSRRGRHSRGRGVASRRPVPDYLDVDVIDPDSGALPGGRHRGGGGPSPSADDETADGDDTEATLGRRRRRR